MSKMNEIMRLVGGNSSTIEWRYNFAQKVSLSFTKWKDENYVYVSRFIIQKSHSICFYVNKNIDVLVNGSDHHYEKIQKEHGKTLEQLFD